MVAALHASRKDHEDVHSFLVRYVFTTATMPDEQALAQRLLNDVTHEPQKIKAALLQEKEITSTGGGSYKSILTQQDVQILAMVAPQVQPLQNPFNDAAFYFGDTELISEDMQTVLTVNDVNQDDSANMDNHQTLLTNNYMEQNSDKPHTITSNTKDNHQTHLANNYVEQNIDKPHTITSNTKGICFILLFNNGTLWNELLI
ncbi:unnamed protein product [Parnassius apollo]|uniref:(apollo) hypothetical protein n=1 Tax=Parnassius apollo TaxID=110799 RepID=A0A8S3XDP5_PARAO|nr:unnamed protein product [Parnassius apollo]